MSIGTACPGCFAGELPFANVSRSCVDGESDSGDGTDGHGIEGNGTGGKQSGLVGGGGGSAMFSHLNVRSLLPKYDEVQVLLEGCGAGQVLGLSEMWLDESVTDAEVAVNGYHMHRRDRGMRGGGVLVYVSDDIRSVRRRDLEAVDMEALWIEVKVRERKVLLCIVFRSPDTLAAWMDNMAVMVERAVQEKTAVVMLGDFNCDMMNPDSRAAKLAMVMSEYGLQRMVNSPTRVTERSETQIDLLFTTDADLIKEVGCDELGLSDHNLIFGVLDVKIEKLRQNWRMIRCYRSCDVDRLVLDLDSAPWQVMDSMEGIDGRWEYWKQLFGEIVESQGKGEAEESTMGHSGNQSFDEGT